jgi:tetratricopeptide (TPR) repeat protein
MLIERARTLLEMGDRTQDRALVEEARDVFEQTGARVDLAFSLHVLARQTAVSQSDIGAALQVYDQAITLLDEVRAEYDLGLASQARARLLAQLDRHEEAHADLSRARGCFIASVPNTTAEVSLHVARRAARPLDLNFVFSVSYYAVLYDLASLG